MAYKEKVFDKKTLQTMHLAKLKNCFGLLPYLYSYVPYYNFRTQTTSQLKWEPSGDQNSQVSTSSKVKTKKGFSVI